MNQEHHRRSTDRKENRKPSYAGTWLNKPMAILSIILLSPIIISNILMAKSTNKPVFSVHSHTDALGRKLAIYSFNCGLFKKMAILFNVIKGDISLCGASIEHCLEPKYRYPLLEKYTIPSGIFSLYDLHMDIGLRKAKHHQLMEEQANGSSLSFISLIIKSILCKQFYGSNTENLNSPKRFNIFGITIDNIKMKEAINWILSDTKGKEKVGFFVNVNSINLSSEKPELKDYLLKADKVFADGSGIRLAAKHVGIKLQDNVNGTDLLPYLCKAASKEKQSLYFFGAEPGIAIDAADNLRKQFPVLKISGTRHGYFNQNENEQIINAINTASPDIILVALGSPIQEKWVIENAEKLNCKTILAVGGLFDFYSGKIPRSPLWMREIGMEWVWRLLQEPKSKFKRYVIGNPLFLFRTFILNQA